MLWGPCAIELEREDEKGDLANLLEDEEI